MTDPHMVRTIFDEAERLFSAPDSWCQNACAKDKYGLSVFSAMSPNAVSWCISGGITKASGGQWNDNVREVRKLIRKVILQENIAEWNDRKSRRRQDISVVIYTARGLIDAQ